MPMVSYQTFVSVVNEVARDEYGQNRGIGYQSDLMQVIGQAWSNNKETLTEYTRQQAREWAKRNIDFEA